MYIDIFTGHQVLRINPDEKSLEVKNLSTSEVFTESYDKLVVSTGASPMLLPIKGIDKNNVFVLRNVRSADRIKSYIEQYKPRRALVIGSGFIGLEVVENLKTLGIDVDVVEMEDHLMKPFVYYSIKDDRAKEVLKLAEQMMSDISEEKYQCMKY